MSAAYTRSGIAETGSAADDLISFTTMSRTGGLQYPSIAVCFVLAARALAFLA